MKRVFETAECEEVRNSIFWELRYEKHENQMKGCGVELRVSDLQMNACTWRVYDTVKVILMIQQFIRHCNMSMKSLQGRRTPGSRDECRTAPDGFQPLDQDQWS